MCHFLSALGNMNIPYEIFEVFMKGTGFSIIQSVKTRPNKKLLCLFFSCFIKDCYHLLSFLQELKKQTSVSLYYELLSKSIKYANITGVPVYKFVMNQIAKGADVMSPSIRLSCLEIVHHFFG